MAKAKAEVTISRVVDISSVTRYYLLQVSTASAPAKPTANPPGGSWTTTEPTYTAGSTNTLYTVELTVFTNNTFSYSDVSKSTSYEAAKAAYNKALESAKTATNYVKSDTAGLIVGNVTASTLGFNTLIKTNGFDIRNGSTVLSSFGANSATIGQSNKSQVYIDNDGVDIKFSGITVSSFSAGKIELGKNVDNATIELCNGAGVIATSQDRFDSTHLDISSDSGYIDFNSQLGFNFNSSFDNSTFMGYISINADAASRYGDDGSRIPGARYVINVDNEVSNKRNTAEFTMGENGTISLEATRNDSESSASITINSSDNTVMVGDILQTGQLIANSASTFKSTVDFVDHIYIKNGKYIQSYTTDNEAFTMLHANSGNNIVLGYGSYELSKGNTYIYGNQVRVVTRDNLFYANGYLVPKMTKGDTSYYGLMTPENSTAGWIRTTESGLIPSAHGVSSIGSSSWQFKNGYFQNLYVNGKSVGAWTSFTMTNISTATSSTAWVAKYNSALDLVSIRGYVEFTPSAEISAGTEFSIGTIPSDYRPAGNTAISVYRNVTNSTEIRGRASSDGNIYLRYGTKMSAGTSAGFYINTVYYKDM